MDQTVRSLHLDEATQDAQLVSMILESGMQQLPARLQYIRTKEKFLAAPEVKDFDFILWSIAPDKPEYFDYLLSVNGYPDISYWGLLI